MKKFNLFFVFIAFAILTFTSSCKKDKPDSPPDYDLTKLNAVKVSSSPAVDGVVDNLWTDVPALVVALGETNNPPNDPSQIGNCTSCHAYNSDISVTVKTVYSGDNIYFLTEWNDPTASFTRGNSWVWDGTVWNRNAHTEQSEDRMSFFWPMGDISGSPYNTGGCMTKCHMYYPTDTDPHVSSHGIVDDAWLTSGRADMWHSKAARGTAYTSATGLNLTIDPATFEVTGGTFSMIGYADDKYVDVWADDATNGEDGGRYGDAGTSAYSHNRIGDKSRPKYMEKNPLDYADAMTLTQAEIDAGECVGDATNGVSDADASTYWSKYTALTAVIPERILRQTDGSRADLLFGTVWNNGKWTAEFARKLNTGYDDDIQFTDFSKEYLFNIAEFDNSRHGYEHRTSESYFLKFWE